MSNRREFLMQTTAAILLASADVPVMAANKRGGPRPGIRQIVRRDETIIRYGGNGDVFPLSWASDDRQFSALLDGVGWSKTRAIQYNTRVFSVWGGPQQAKFEDLSGYPELAPMGREPRYYGFGLLAQDGRIYQFLNAIEVTPQGSHWVGTKLIYSPDNGRIWCNQDGSTPVVWESDAQRSTGTLLFFKESNQVFSLVSLLQMGQDYGDNRDGYIYLYSPNGFSDGLMNQLVMARVRKRETLRRQAYEFFAGLNRDGNAQWSPAIDARAVVCEFPRGWVNTMNGADTMIAQSWLPSVTYNAPLGLYLMANWGNGCASDGSWFGKPSYLGFWTAPAPWGPWTQVHEETAWMPGEDKAARCYSPQIAPKWIAPDGKSFWLVWTDFQGVIDMNEQAKKQGITGENLSHEDRLRMMRIMRQVAPYYSFNVQRVDLAVA